MRTRPAKPTALLKLAGTYREDRHSDRHEPATSLPAAPAWLPADAKPHFDRLANELFADGLMADTYVLTVALLAQSLADWLRFSEEAAKAPLIVSTKGGEYPHPLHKMKAKAWEQLLKACREFGLSPSAVAGVQTTKKQAAVIPSRMRGAS